MVFNDVFSQSGSQLASPYLRICNDLENLINDCTADSQSDTITASASLMVIDATGIKSSTNNFASKKIYKSDKEKALNSSDNVIGSYPLRTSNQRHAELIFGNVKINNFGSDHFNFGEESDADSFKSSDTTIINKKKNVNNEENTEANSKIFDEQIPSDPQGKAPSRSVWIGNLSASVIKEELISEFSRFGAIESYRFLENKSCAFINFVQCADAVLARQQLNGQFVAGSLLKTGFARPQGNERNGPGDEYSKNSTVNENGEPHLEIGADISKKTNDNYVDKRFENKGDDCLEYCKPFPPLPHSMFKAPAEFDLGTIKECRRRIDHLAITAHEIDTFAYHISEYILPLTIHPIGNILIQRLLERGGQNIPDLIIQKLSPFIATVGIHKNGTWAVQRLIKHCTTNEQRNRIIENLKPYLVQLFRDQFGNYVVQCCLSFEGDQNQFISDAIYHRCVEIGTSRFGSRAMKSCLESSFFSREQIDHVAMAIISHASILVRDINGIIIIQWLLESRLLKRFQFLYHVLSGSIGVLALSKISNPVIAAFLSSSVDAACKIGVIEELTMGETLPLLIKDPSCSGLILKIFTESGLNPDERVKYAHRVLSVLGKVLKTSSSVGNVDVIDEIKFECEVALSLVELDENSSECSSMSTLSRSIGFSVSRPTPNAVGGPIRSSAHSRSGLINGPGGKGRFSDEEFSDECVKSIESGMGSSRTVRNDEDDHLGSSR